ncbi:MAG TPA: FHA domain-containing protein, partial [Gemmatimonadaceae bacterium]|nr:FHA domain-containing protein [Gemmatimonadaceae bacterium]
MTWLEHNEALQELHPDSEVVVGTGAQATWRLRRADLMPRHFVVSTSVGGARIRPFSGDTVVTVNGRQLPTGISELHDGDVIEAGSGEFRFWATTPGESRNGMRSPVTAYLVDTRRRAALSLDRVSTGIGRDESNVLVIDDDGAETFHAEVRREAGGHALRGSNSSLVKVNGRSVSAPVMLNEGDEVEIANLVLRYTRGALPEGVSAMPTVTLTSGVDAEPIAATARGMRPSGVSDLSSAMTIRTP